MNVTNISMISKKHESFANQSNHLAAKTDVGSYPIPLNLRDNFLDIPSADCKEIYALHSLIYSPSCKYSPIHLHNTLSYNPEKLLCVHSHACFKNRKSLIY